MAGTTIILAICFVSLFGLDPSPFAAIASLRGDSLTVEPAVSDLGTGSRGDIRDFHIRVHNHTDRTVRIVGRTVDCSCNATDGLPMTVSAREIRSLKVQYRFSGQARAFQDPFVLYTDDEAQPLVVARVAGRIVEVIER